MGTQEWIRTFLMMDGNETNLLDNVEQVRDFKRICVELSKKEHNIRWCSNHHCACHPESTIKYILENNQGLVEHLEYLIDYESFKEFIYGEYKPITVFSEE